MNRGVQFVFFLIMVISAYVYIKPSPTSPIEYDLGPLPSLPVNNDLSQAEMLWKNRRLMRAPECLVVDPQGKYMYTGTHDGRILRMNIRNPKGR